ncbi:hypothetical protein, partial [Staphylococcus aureus]
HTKPNIGGKSSIFHPKKTKIEDIFHGCLRFFGSKGTNGSAPFFMHFTYDILYFGLKITQIEVSHLYFS